MSNVHTWAVYVPELCMCMSNVHTWAVYVLDLCMCMGLCVYGLYMCLRPSKVCALWLQVNPMTAYGLLDTAKPPKGEYMLQTAAGSTLGRMITALAGHWGVNIIDVVRRSEQKDELLKLG